MDLQHLSWSWFWSKTGQNREKRGRTGKIEKNQNIHNICVFLMNGATMFVLFNVSLNILSNTPCCRICYFGFCTSLGLCVVWQVTFARVDQTLYSGLCISQDPAEVAEDSSVSFLNIQPKLTQLLHVMVPASLTTPLKRTTSAKVLCDSVRVDIKWSLAFLSLSVRCLKRLTFAKMLLFQILSNWTYNILLHLSL